MSCSVLNSILWSTLSNSLLISKRTQAANFLLSIPLREASVMLSNDVSERCHFLLPFCLSLASSLLSDS